MPLFRRKPEEPLPVVPDETDASPTEPQPVVGDLPCNEEGCSSHLGASCEYIDRRRKQCTTAWCPEHQTIVDNMSYCRRHANTLDAISGPSFTVYGTGLPDVQNRVPSLVRWMGIDLDTDIHTLLEQVRNPDASFQKDPIHVVVGIDGTHRWEKTWHLYDHTGSVLRVTAEVSETEPITFNMRVNNALIFHDSPPWILRHVESKASKENIDEVAERRTFHDEILKVLAPAILKDPVIP